MLSLLEVEVVVMALVAAVAVADFLLVQENH
jgi:hypothetical protein